MKSLIIQTGHPRLKQCVKAIIFKYFNEQCPNYLNKVFDVTIENNFQLRGSFQKL